MPFDPLEKFRQEPLFHAPVQDGDVFLDAVKVAAFPEEWEECDEGYSEQWRTDQVTVVRCFRGPFSTRKDFVDYMLGYCRVDPDANNAIKRVIPAQHPEYPWMYAQEANLV